MKKINLLFLALLFGSFTFQIANAQIFSDDFESGNLSKWSNGAGTYSIRAVTTSNPAAGTYACQITGGSYGWADALYADFTASQPTQISWKLKVTDLNTASGYFNIGDNGSNYNFLFSLVNYSYDGLFFIGDNTYYNFTSIQANTWYKIELKNINWTTKKYDIYIDSILKYADFSMYNTNITSISKVSVGNFDNTTSYFDDIYVGFTSCTAANVTTEPKDSSICPGKNALFGYIATGSIDSFRWERNSGSGWSAVANSNNDTITITNATQSAQYRGIAFAACGKDTTRAVQLTVNSLPTTMLTSSRNPSVNGYAPYQCTNLKANASGFGSLGISWAHGPATDTSTVCPTVGQWYKVTVTDGHGCVKRDSIRQYVTNASTPYPGYSLICYKYPSRNIYYSLSVQQSQIPYYLGLGATLGACGSTPSKRGEEATFAEIADLYKFYPNPMSNTLNVEWFNLFNEEVSIDLLDMTSKVVKTIYNGPVVEGELINLQADMTELNNGMYLLRFSSNSDYRINKVQLIR